MFINFTSFEKAEKPVMVLCFALLAIILYLKLSDDNLNNASLQVNSVQNYTATRDYAAIKKQVQDIKNEIWEEWDVSTYPLFLTLMHIPTSSWELQKQKLLNTILNNDMNKNSSFIISFSGSSITAGHDNYIYEAYPNVFYETLLPIMNLLSLPFSVRNQALGNNPCYPYDLCVNTHMGTDFDVLTWEESMNCGKNPIPLEIFTRSVLNMSKSPTIIYIQSGTPIITHEMCMNRTNNDLSFNQNEFSYLLNTPYKMIADNQNHLKAMNFLKYGNNLNDNLYKYYSEVSPMGQNVLPIEKYSCFGPYNESFSTKTPGGGAYWHPGRIGHRLRGHSLAYAYLSILEDALSELDDLYKNDNHNLFQNTISRLQFSEKYISTKGKVNIKFKEGKVCGDICDNANCFTDYLPRENNPLSSLLVGNPVIGINTFNDTNNITAFTSTLKYLHKYNASSYNWTFGISFFDVKGVEKSLKNNLGYYDRKYIYTSNGMGSVLSFRISPTKKHSIWICECQKGFLKYPANMNDLDIGSNLYLWENISTQFIDSFNNDNLSQSLIHSKLLPPLIKTNEFGWCYETIPIDAGNHIISIQQKGNFIINIAYIIYW